MIYAQYIYSLQGMKLNTVVSCVVGTSRRIGRPMPCDEIDILNFPTPVGVKCCHRKIRISGVSENRLIMFVLLGI